MKQRILYLLKFYLLTVLIFIVAKVVFMVCNASSHPFALSDLFEVIWNGLSLDLSTSLYLFALPFLLVLLSLWMNAPRIFRGVIYIYDIIISAALSLAFIADTSLYGFWQFKLDASCLQYLSTPTEVMSSVSGGYIVVRIVLFVAVVSLMSFLYNSLIIKKTFEKILLKERYISTLGWLLLLPVVIIGIRGGVAESTTNVGQVYYSSNQYLNHSAVNPFFSFVSSLSKSGDYIISYDYFDDAECHRITAGCFDVKSIDSDTLLTTTRPNILLIVMESCGGQFTEIGGRHDITPNLNRLSGEGIYFTECYANSWRTDKGLVSILSGYPSFPITSIMKIPAKSRNLPSIASSLRTAGYKNSFYYGGDVNYSNMRSYVMGTGYDDIKWKSDYTAEEQASAKWGVRDDIMFSSLLEDIKSKDEKGPWMKTLLTLSSHEPWDVPIKKLDDEIDNSFYYLDECLGNFVQELRSTPLWEKLLVIILPDHGLRTAGVNETSRVFNHIPMIWLGGVVKEPCRISKICNQSDLAATLLGQMQLSHDEFTFSRDVLSKNYQRQMAFHTYVNGYSVFDSCSFVSFDLDANKTIVSEGNNTDSLLQLGKALLQMKAHDLINK